MFRSIRTTVLALSVTLAATVSHADARLDDISAWFNGWKTMSSPFTQTYDDGSKSTGTLYMKRPGSLRIEYDDQEAMLVASNGAISIYEGDWSADEPQVYPLKKTPLWLILRPDVDLKTSSAIRSVTRSGGLVKVMVADDEHPEAGSVELHFADRENAFLVGWISYPESGEEVTVRLTAPVIGENLDSKLFTRPTKSRSDH